MLESLNRVFNRRKITDHGSMDFKTHKAPHEGSVMDIASKDIVQITKSTTIKEAANVMAKNGVRRLPVVDAGTRRLVGLLSARDVVDFLGGGEKHKLFAQNPAAFLNHSVAKIMEENVFTLSDQSTIADAIKLFISREIGGAPVLDKDNRVVGVVSERDLVMLLSDKVTGMKVRDCMTRRVITATHGTSVEDAARIMLKNGFRRLPVTRGELLHGFVSSVDLVKMIADNTIFKGDVRVEDIMSTDVVTVTPDSELGEVAAKISKHEHGAFPVVEDGRLVGIITERDLLKAIQ